MKKKLLCPLLVIMMCTSLTACGGGDSNTTPSNTEAPAATTAPDSSEGSTDEQMEELTKAYNQVADIYNDVVTKYEENGWAADEELTATLQIVDATMTPVGQFLAGDTSALDGADLSALTSSILEYQTSLEEISEKVSVPYEDSAE